GGDRGDGSGEREGEQARSCVRLGGEAHAQRDQGGDPAVREHLAAVAARRGRLPRGSRRTRIRQPGKEARRDEECYEQRRPSPPGEGEDRPSHGGGGDRSASVQPTELPAGQRNGERAGVGEHRAENRNRPPSAREASQWTSKRYGER